MEILTAISLILNIFWFIWIICAFVFLIRVPEALRGIEDGIRSGFASFYRTQYVDYPTIDIELSRAEKAVLLIIYENATKHFTPQNTSIREAVFETTDVMYAETEKEAKEVLNSLLEKGLISKDMLGYRANLKNN
jgi:hypothetical protein